MSVVAFTPDRNSPGKSDFKGAFLPEALAFVKLHGGNQTDVVTIDMSKPPAWRRSYVLSVLAMRGPSTIAFVCHGFRNGLQLGFNLPQARDLARVIANGGTVAGSKITAPRIALYACSTGGGIGKDARDGDGGFADRLRDELCAAGAVLCRVDAHDRAGHCTRLPFVRRFEGGSSPVGGTGGQWIVAPGSALWARWRKALQTTDLRLRYPTMHTAEVHMELLKAKR